MTADVVIVGGGIVGAACADRLAAEGLRVIVIEPAVVGGGATAAGMGHLVVMDDSDAQFALTNHSRNLWNQLSAELPPEAEFEPCGTIWVAADEEEMDAVREKHAYYTTRGVRAEILAPPALYEAEPHLRPGLAGALLVPDDSTIYAPCTANWLLRRNAKTRIVRAAVTAFKQGEVSLDDGSRISAGSIICANGTWITKFFPGLGIRLRKGHLAITDRYPAFVRHQIVELGYLKSVRGSSDESVAFNAAPRKTGQVLIGSSRQYNREDSAVNAPMLSRMLARAIEYMPALARLSVIRAWTGFRAATADKLPLIGLYRDGLYIAAGHEGLGITTSLGTAELLTAAIMRQAPAIPAEPYLPTRKQVHD